MIYTKTGDKGQTSLANGQRVPKTDARIEAYGTVDELNSWIGQLRALVLQAQTSQVHPSQAELAQADTAPSEDRLCWIQNKLFNLGAALSEAPGTWIVEADVKQLEHWIDDTQAHLPQLRAFVLPTGNSMACTCHICRTVCRRAERRMIEAEADAVALQFINRMSDYLFVLARYLNCRFKMEEEVWKKQ